MTTLLAALVVSGTIWIAPLQGYEDLDHYALGIYELTPGEVVIQGAALDVSTGNTAYVWTAEYYNQQVSVPVFSFESQLLMPGAIWNDIPIQGIDVAIRGYVFPSFGGAIYLGDAMPGPFERRTAFVYTNLVPEPSAYKLGLLAVLFLIAFWYGRVTKPSN